MLNSARLHTFPELLQEISSLNFLMNLSGEVGSFSGGGLYFGISDREKLGRTDDL